MLTWIVIGFAGFGVIRAAMDLRNLVARHIRKEDLERERQLWRIKSEGAKRDRVEAPVKKAG